MSEKALQVYRNPNALQRGGNAASPTGYAPAALTQEMVETIKRTIAREATDTELELFLHQCRRTGLDPLNRQIYFVKPKNAPAYIVVGIDGFRLIAERTGQYRGMTPPEWCGLDGQWVDIWLRDEPPAACRVGVLRAGFEAPVYGIAKYTEFAAMVKNQDGGKRPTEMWAKMPSHMLRKCAESQALRMGFPNELSGLYTEDEMGQAQNGASGSRGGRSSVPAPAPPSPVEQFREAWQEYCSVSGVEPGDAQTRLALSAAILGRKISGGADVRKTEWTKLAKGLREKTEKERADQAEARAQREAMEGDEETVHQSEIVDESESRESAEDGGEDPFQDQ